MDPIAKKFARASLVYLGVGVLLGIHMAFADHNLAQLRFIHVHLLLLGFMAMMIYGVAYHILPRFNARPLPYPRLVPFHWHLANAGLVGMVSLFAVGAFFGGGPLRMLFGLFGTVEAAGIACFIANMYPILAGPSVAEGAAPAIPEVPPAPRVKVDPNQSVADLLGQWPHLEEAMNGIGLGGIAAPAVRESAARMVTLKMAVQKEGLDLGTVIATLEGGRVVTPGDEAPAHPDGFMPIGDQIARGAEATPRTQIGNLLEVYPETAQVFSRHYGEACFSCPGQKTETVEQTAMMHNMPVDQILAEINGIIRQVR